LLDNFPMLTICLLYTVGDKTTQRKPSKEKSFKKDDH